MTPTCHITSGDSSGDLLAKSGIPGEILVWHDILYEGPREPGWPTAEILDARSRFLETNTGGGLTRETVLKELTRQYRYLEQLAPDQDIVLWFDACLFDQAMLAHILACLHILGRQQVYLIEVDRFPGIEPFNGLGQLSPEQMASLWNRRRPVTDSQFRFAESADSLFAVQDLDGLQRLSETEIPPLPHLPAAAARWLLEQPDPDTGLGRLDALALDAVGSGEQSPLRIFRAVARADTPPQYWGDTTLWSKINRLADRGLVRIDGPEPRLPQWQTLLDLGDFTVRPVS